MIAMEELLSLKWNNHRSTFLHILAVLRDKQLYTDVTIACDGKFYSVHKLVLSTCSDYFSGMFDKTACKSPIIVLKDIKSEDLEALLDYMYLGEVNVRQSDLASLIKSAECLRIKGLAVPDDEPPKKHVASNKDVKRTDNISSSPPSKRKSSSPPPKRKRRDEGEDGRDDVRPCKLPSPLPPSSSYIPKTSPAQHISPIPHRTSQPSPESGRSTSPNRMQPSEMTPTNPSASEPSGTQFKAQNQDIPYVKVEMEDPGDDIQTAETYDITNDGYKEEDDDDDGADLSNDLPEFLQQAASGAYPHSSFPGPSTFQHDLSSWQSEQGYSGLGFSGPSSQDGSQNPGDANASSSWNEKYMDSYGLPDEAQRSSNGEINTALQCSSSNSYITPQHKVLQANTEQSLANEDHSITNFEQRHQNYHFCPICTKTFRTGKDCRRHMVIHTDIKPFKCPYCPHKANLKYNLTKHIRKKHNVAITLEKFI